MRAFDFAFEFEAEYGVIYRPYLRDGEDFTGSVKRAARELAQEHDESDDELFALHGGVEKVRRRLLAKWEDETQSLARLNPAEERVLILTGLEHARLAAMSIQKINELVGYGMFADRKIRHGDFIGEYTGVLRQNDYGDEHNRYLARTPPYGRFTDFLIDGQDEGNFTRFINHSFQAANVRSEHAFYDQRWHRVLRAERDILPGEQLLWNYGDEYWRNREVPEEL